MTKCHSEPFDANKAMTLAEQAIRKAIHQTQVKMHRIDERLFACQVAHALIFAYHEGWQEGFTRSNVNTDRIINRIAHDVQTEGSA